MHAVKTDAHRLSQSDSQLERSCSNLARFPSTPTGPLTPSFSSFTYILYFLLLLIFLLPAWPSSSSSSSFSSQPGCAVPSSFWLLHQTTEDALDEYSLGGGQSRHPMVRTSQGMLASSSLRRSSSCHLCSNAGSRTRKMLLAEIELHVEDITD